MSKNKVDSTIKSMQEIKFRKLSEIRRSIENSPSVPSDEYVIQGILDGIEIEINCLGDPSQNGKGFYEVVIKSGDSTSYEYYNSDFEMVAEKKKSDSIDLISQYRDRPELLYQIERLLGERNKISLKELETIKKVADEKGIDIQELYEVPLGEEIEGSKDSEHELSQEQMKSFNVKEKVKTSQLIDGKQTLGKALDLDKEGFYELWIVESSDVDPTNNTRYSIIGIKKELVNGENEIKAEVLSGSKFKISGKDGITSDDSYSINANNTAGINQNRDSSYEAKGKPDVGVSIGKDEKGQVRVYFER